jgi:DNA-binding Lrp family transcriptional regulator
MKALVRNGRRMTVVQIAAEVGLSVGSVHAILKEDLGMCRVCAKFVL